MQDKLGRSINYVRVSVTDRCDLRCTYCMPADGVPLKPHSEVLTYEEIYRITSLLAQIGVKKVRLTGGEPLVRKGIAGLVRRIKEIDGIERVCLTTNGILLSEQLPELILAGLDSVNISLDAIDEDVFSIITRRSGVEKVLSSIAAAVDRGLSVKINCVPTMLNEDQIIPMAERFLTDEHLSLRFIELMPIGLGRTLQGLSTDAVKDILSESFGPLRELETPSLSGPCRYYKLEGLDGKVGFISAVSNCFCAQCNRVRLTSDGFLKTCLQFDHGVQLKPLLKSSDEEILAAMRKAIWDKPEHHLFLEKTGEHFENHIMSQIGG